MFIVVLYTFSHTRIHYRCKYLQVCSIPIGVLHNFYYNYSYVSWGSSLCLTPFLLTLCRSGKVLIPRVHATCTYVNICAHTGNLKLYTIKDGLAVRLLRDVHLSGCVTYYKIPRNQQNCNVIKRIRILKR